MTWSQFPRSQGGTRQDSKCFGQRVRFNFIFCSCLFVVSRHLKQFPNGRRLPLICSALRCCSSRCSFHRTIRSIPVKSLPTCRSLRTLRQSAKWRPCPALRWCLNRCPKCTICHLFLFFLLSHRLPQCIRKSHPRRMTTKSRLSTNRSKHQKMEMRELPWTNQISADGINYDPKVDRSIHNPTLIRPEFQIWKLRNPVQKWHRIHPRIWVDPVFRNQYRSIFEISDHKVHLKLVRSLRIGTVQQP